MCTVDQDDFWFYKDWTVVFFFGHDSVVDVLLDTTEVDHGELWKLCDACHSLMVVSYVAVGANSVGNSFGSVFEHVREHAVDWDLFVVFPFGDNVCVVAVLARLFLFGFDLHVFEGGFDRVVVHRKRARKREIGTFLV